MINDVEVGSYTWISLFLFVGGLFVLVYLYWQRWGQNREKIKDETTKEEKILICMGFFGLSLIGISIYLFFDYHPFVEGAEAGAWLLFLIGAIVMIIGTWIKFQICSDIKKVGLDKKIYLSLMFTGVILFTLGGFLLEYK